MCGEGDLLGCQGESREVFWCVRLSVLEKQENFVFKYPSLIDAE